MQPAFKRKILDGESFRSRNQTHPGMKNVSGRKNKNIHAHKRLKRSPRWNWLFFCLNCCCLLEIKKLLLLNLLYVYDRTPNFDGVYANSRWEDASPPPTRSPYNSKTGCNCVQKDLLKPFGCTINSLVTLSYC